MSFISWEMAADLLLVMAIVTQGHHLLLSGITQLTQEAIEKDVSILIGMPPHKEALWAVAKDHPIHTILTLYPSVLSTDSLMNLLDHFKAELFLLNIALHHLKSDHAVLIR